MSEGKYTLEDLYSVKESIDRNFENKVGVIKSSAETLSASEYIILQKELRSLNEEEMELFRKFVKVENSILDQKLV